MSFAPAKERMETTQANKNALSRERKTMGGHPPAVLGVRPLLAPIGVDHQRPPWAAIETARKSGMGRVGRAGRTTHDARDEPGERQQRLDPPGAERPAVLRRLAVCAASVSIHCYQRDCTTAQNAISLRTCAASISVCAAAVIRRASLVGFRNCSGQPRAVRIDESSRSWNRRARRIRELFSARLTLGGQLKAAIAAARSSRRPSVPCLVSPRQRGGSRRTGAGQQPDRSARRQ